jgi:hypothetical protein
MWVSPVFYVVKTPNGYEAFHNEEHIRNDEVDSADDDHRPCAFQLCRDIWLEVCEHYLVISQNQVRAFVVALQLVDVLVEERLEFQQVNHKQQAQPDVNEHLDNSVFWVGKAKAKEDVDESSDQVNEIVVEDTFVACSELVVKEVPLLIEVDFFTLAHKWRS